MNATPRQGAPDCPQEAPRASTNDFDGPGTATVAESNTRCVVGPQSLTQPAHNVAELTPLPTAIVAPPGPRSMPTSCQGARPSISADTGQLRCIRDCPFAWQEKQALRAIREYCEDCKTALLVYFTLTCIASDKAKETFEVTHQWIASMCGLSEKTVRKRLKDLKRLDVIDFYCPPLKTACHYRLLRFGTGYRAFGNGALSPLPTSEEQKKAEREPDSIPNLGPRGIPQLDAVLAYAQTIGLAEWKARDWFDEMEGCGWKDHQKREVVSWEALLRRVFRKWEADEKPSAPPSRSREACARRRPPPRPPEAPKRRSQTPPPPPPPLQAGGRS